MIFDRSATEIVRDALANGPLTHCALQQATRLRKGTVKQAVLRLREEGDAVSYDAADGSRMHRLSTPVERSVVRDRLRCALQDFWRGIRLAA